MLFLLESWYPDFCVSENELQDLGNVIFEEVDRSEDECQPSE